ncbi:MAG: hypothetical protein SFV21_03995 [Rhodospirillaceae bacterium]|nr:hypothetical protein [Rhodospirillaceae bacterium]
MYGQGARGYQEGLLVDTIDRIRRNPEGRKVVHVRLSQLLPANRTAVRIKIIARMFRTLESGRHVQLFQISNDDLVLIVSPSGQRDVNNICDRIRTIFENDPITAIPPGGQDRFVLWFDLSLDAQLAIHTAQQLKQMAQKMPPRNDAAALPPLTPATLDDIQKKLAHINVIPFVRDQVACRVNPATYEAQIEFYEFFLSVGDIQRQIAPRLNILGDRWLFQDLSRTMDMRMLEVVVHAPHARGVPAISLNLNLETVTTPVFAAFLERIEPGQRIIVEVQAIDVLTNLSLYGDVKGALSELGHAVLIDGLTPATLKHLDVTHLQPDYAKLIWAPELTDMMDPSSDRSAAFVIKQVGAERIVLSRCDSQDALAWGVKSGIHVFQGRFLDAFGKPGRKRARPGPQAGAGAAPARQA